MEDKGKLTALALTSRTTCTADPLFRKNDTMLRNTPARAQKYVALATGFNQAADTLEGLARALRPRSTYMNHVADEAMDWEPARPPSEAEVLAMVSEIMGEGITEARAISLTAKRLALPYDLTVRALKKGRKLERAKAGERRNRRIMQRAALGWTNQDIADAEGMHRQSVARIVAKERHAAIRLGAGG